MINESILQSQNRIKRQMLEQSLAIPYDVDTFDSKNYEERFMGIIGKKLVSDIDSKMLETNPMYKVSAYADKVKLEHISPEKFYNDKVKIRHVPNITVEDYKPELELTLVNGVFE